MPHKIKNIAEAVTAYIRSGQSMMVGGFGRGGVPFSIIDYLADHPEQYKGLILYKNDANEPDLGIGRLLKNRQVKHLYTTHIGLNPAFIAQMNAGEIACTLTPQGIFAEKIRAGGAGIPAFLSDIGLHTSYAKGKEKMTLDGQNYILERAYHADVAIICADMVDQKGNCWWQGSNRNMCVAMGTACDHVIVEAKEIVDTGRLQPENIHLPGVFVSAVVRAEPRRHQQEAAA
ncbi:MAG: CoA transferase subunit A [Proteobacteria bacterium]|nr:CoA transferase subunit A [Pseudomonadota bacterium]